MSCLRWPFSSCIVDMHLAYYGRRGWCTNSWLQVLEELKQRIFPSTDSSEGVSSRALVLHGTPGVGKSSLAYCLMEAASSTYSKHAVWVDLRGISTLLAAALQVLQSLGQASQGPQQQDSADAKQYTNEDEALAVIAKAVQSSPWREQGLVVVLDNAEELQRCSEKNVPLGKLVGALSIAQHRVIVTTRKQYKPPKGVFKTVPKLERERSRECFLGEVEHQEGKPAFAPYGGTLPTLSNFFVSL